MISRAPASAVHRSEQQRIDAVRRYDVLDTPPDGAFDRITAIAARRFAVPISIISIIDADRIWFKSHHGLDVEEIPREPGLCASAILSSDPWILENAAQDARSLANPLVAGEFGLRFYAGVPLATGDGYNLGTLCVIDKKPRAVSEDEIRDLRDLASVVMDEMELRLAARRAVGRANLMAREIDHRVMNSLQFVTSMLRMQARNVHGKASRELELAANRVGAVARVHQHFHAEGEATQIDFLPYLRRLCGDLGEILEVRIHVRGASVAIHSSRMQPLGLIVNEVITNSAKYGATEVEVALSALPDDNVELSVSDNGNGLPDGFDPSHSGSGMGMGMKIIHSLLPQISGRMVAGNRRNRGARIAFTFSAWPAPNCRCAAAGRSAKLPAGSKKAISRSH